MAHQDETLQQSGDALERSRQDSAPEEAPQVPGYQLKQAIGRGSFGEVWSGVQLRTGQMVAVKVCFSARFDRAQTWRELERLREVADHPSVVTLLDADLEHNPPYLVMPLLRQSLSSLPGPPSVEQAAAWLAQAASGLKHTHDKGILHCDIKPSNLALDEGGRAVLLDFGQARQHGEGQNSWGTLGYMPPEQTHEAPGVRWDVYALAATFYRLLGGRFPYLETDQVQQVSESQTLEQRMRRYSELLFQGRLIPLRQLNPRVDSDLADILEACLELDPEKRTATVAQLLDDLERRRNGEPLLCRRPWSFAYVAGKRLRRPLALLSLSLSLLLVVGGVTAYLRLRSTHQQLQLRSQQNEELLASLASERGDERLASGNQEEARLWWAQALKYRPEDRGLRLALGLPAPRRLARWPGNGFAVSSSQPLWALWQEQELLLFRFGQSRPLSRHRFGGRIEGVLFHPDQAILGVLVRSSPGGVGFQAFSGEGQPRGELFSIPSAEASWTRSSRLLVFSRAYGTSLWDTQSGKCLQQHRLPLHHRLLDFNPRSVVQGTSDLVVAQVGRRQYRRFRGSDGLTQSPPLESGGLEQVEMSEDGNTVAFSDDHRTLLYRGGKVEDYPMARLMGLSAGRTMLLESGRLRVLGPDGLAERMELQVGEPRRVVCSADGNGLALVYDRRVELRDRRDVFRHSVRLPGVRSCAFSADGHYLVAASDMSVACWEVPTPYQPRRLATGESNVWQVQFHPQGWLAALSASRLSLWDSRTGKSLRQIELEGSGQFFSLHPRGGLAVVAGRSLHYLASSTQSDVQRLPWEAPVEGGTQLPALAFRPDGGWLAVAEADGILVYPCEGGQLSRPSRLDCPAPRQVAFSPDGRWLAALASFGEGFHELRLWSCDGQPQNWQPVRLPDPAQGQPRRLAFDPQGRWLCTSLGQETVLRELPSGRVGLRLPGSRSALEFHPHLPQLALASLRQLDVLSVPDGRPVLSGLRHPEAQRDEFRRHLAWSPSGQWLADTTLQGSEVWIGPNGKPALPYLRAQATSCLAFNHDESLLAVGTESGEVLVYPLPLVQGTPAEVLSEVERTGGWGLDRSGDLIEP